MGKSPKRKPSKSKSPPREPSKTKSPERKDAGENTSATKEDEKVAGDPEPVVDNTPLEDHEDTLEVTGLPSGLDQRSVQEMFQQYGSVDGCKLLDNAEKGQSAALVRFRNVKDAKKFKEKLDKGTVEGSSVPISIEFAVEKRKMLQKKAEEAAKKEAEEKKRKEKEEK